MALHWWQCFEYLWNLMFDIFDCCLDVEVWDFSVRKLFFFLILIFSCICNLPAQVPSPSPKSSLHKNKELRIWHLVFNKGFCYFIIMGFFVLFYVLFCYHLWFLRPLLNMIFFLNLSTEDFNRAQYLVTIRNLSFWIMVIFLFCECDLLKALQSPTVFFLLSKLVWNSISNNPEKVT